MSQAPTSNIDLNTRVYSRPEDGETSVDFSHLQPLRQLRPRLQHLTHWIKRTPNYGAIWDLCCDHGLLGLHLHEQFKSSEVHLVDQVEPIIDQLHAKYSERKDGRLFIQQCSAEDINLTHHARQCFVIAGVGGETAAAIVLALTPKIEALLRSNEKESHLEPPQIDILISPNKHVFALRNVLAQLSITLIEEAFVTDKGRHHEHLFLRFQHQPTHRPSALGETLWQQVSPEKRSYVEKLIRHYQRVCRHAPTELDQQALKAYTKLGATLNIQ